LTKARNRACAIGNFIKYGGVATLTHYKAMLADCISITIVMGLQVVVALPYPLLDHDPPIHIIMDAMGFIVF
jgi:hypothetical protein